MVAVAVLLGALLVLLVQTRQVRLGSAVVCVLFGFVLGITPAGPSVQAALESTGTWVWEQVTSL